MAIFTAPSRHWLVALSLALLLVGCDSNEPVKIGFIGGLSGTNSDNAQAGEKGVILAVEQLNRSGGINGRQVQLLSMDHALDREDAIIDSNQLIKDGVEGVVGPFTSSIASAVLPIYNKAGVCIVSPTASSMALYGKDDQMIRINRTTRDNAREYAHVLYQRGVNRIAVALDTRNRVFTESYLDEFRQALHDLGGEVTVRVDFESGAVNDFKSIVGEMATQPSDGLFFIAGALDVARLAQQARQLGLPQALGATEWAGTEQLVELGGRVIDGLLIVQNFNREDQSSHYLNFREAFFKRFHQEPGYSSVMAHDAATVLFEGLKQRKQGQSTCDAIIANSPYQGLQQRIEFDANGDSRRTVYFTEVRDRQFHLLK